MSQESVETFPGSPPESSSRIVNAMNLQEFLGKILQKVLLQKASRISSNIYFMNSSKKFPRKLIKLDNEVVLQGIFKKKIFREVFFNNVLQEVFKKAHQETVKEALQDVLNENGLNPNRNSI